MYIFTTDNLIHKSMPPKALGLLVSYKQVVVKVIFLIILFIIPFSNLLSINIDSLEKVVNKAPDKNKPELYNILAKSYQNSSFEKADKYANLALQYSQKNEDVANEATAYFNLGYNFVIQNNSGESFKYFQKSLDLRLELGDKAAIASSLNALGNVSRLLGNNQLALEYYLSSLEIRKELGDTLLIAASINNIGIIYKFQGDFEKALEYYLQSLQYAENLNDTVIITPALINIGNIHFDLKRYTKALEYYNRVLDIAQKSNNLSEVASAYNLIGTAYNYMNKIPKALESFELSYQLATKIGNVYTQCDALNNLGESYHRLGDYVQALEYYQKSVEISTKGNDLHSSATTLNNIGSIYLNKKDYKQALTYLQKSLKIIEDLNTFGILKDIYHNLAKVYEGLGDYKKAYQYQCNYTELNDSLLSESMNKKMIDLQIKFETEKKERKIEILKNEKRIESEKKNYFIALSILGILLVIVIFILFILKIRANRILAEKNQLISTQKDKLSVTLDDLNRINKTNEKYLYQINDELSRASDYVLSLIPPEIKTGNIQTRWMLKPSSKLGGDTFGYHWIDSDNFAIYLLDVSGHGVGASLHSIQILNTLKFHTLLNTDYKIPEQVLAKLNKVFQMQNHNKLFFTIWYGVYNKNTKELKYSTAGHPPAIMVDGNGETSFVGTKNFVIGGTKKFDYSSNCITINSPAKLFVFSDGVYEIKDESGNIWTIEYLKELIKQKAVNSDNDLEILYDHVVNLHHNKILDDDFSIIKVMFD